MRNEKARNRRLTVYLLKEELQDFQSIVKDGLEGEEVKVGGESVGELFIKPIQGHTPNWFNLFEGSVRGNLKGELSSRNVSAVFLLKGEKRIFAITFGYGRSLLRPETWEEQFGLKVVLNSIDRNNLRVIDRKNLDTMLTHTRTQMSRKCAIEEFNLDVQQILLKAVTGEPRDHSFASSVSGADALSINCDVTLWNIADKCDEMLEAYASLDYQTTFPWVNNVTEVTNKEQVAELNEELVNRIKSGVTDRLFLAIPDIVEWTEIDGFKFNEADNEVHPDILLNDFLGTVRDPEKLSRDYLKHRWVFLVRADSGIAEKRWSVYHCLNCEIAREKKTYILTDGKWYEVNASFVAQVNDQIGTVCRYSIPLDAKKDEKEDEYCQRLQESDKANYALMDRKMIQYGGANSQLEFCDLYTKDKKLIHLKRYSGSSVLSHLFAQGTNSARAFLADAEFRRRVNEQLPDTHKLDPETSPVAREYEIVFGIISQTADDLPTKLPFFSKITLMRAMRELQGVIGFRMSLAGIKVLP